MDDGTPDESQLALSTEKEGEDILPISRESSDTTSCHFPTRFAKTSNILTFEECRSIIDAENYESAKQMVISLLQPLLEDVTERFCDLDNAQPSDILEGSQQSDNFDMDEPADNSTFASVPSEPDMPTGGSEGGNEEVSNLAKEVHKDEDSLDSLDDNPQFDQSEYSLDLRDELSTQSAHEETSQHPGETPWEALQLEGMQRTAMYMDSFYQEAQVPARQEVAPPTRRGFFGKLFSRMRFGKTKNANTT